MNRQQLSKIENGSANVRVQSLIAILAIDGSGDPVQRALEICRQVNAIDDKMVEACYRLATAMSDGRRTAGAQPDRHARSDPGNRAGR
jgi:hypothetical protein